MPSSVDSHSYDIPKFIYYPGYSLISTEISERAVEQKDQSH